MVLLTPVAELFVPPPTTQAMRAELALPPLTVPKSPRTEFAAPSTPPPPIAAPITLTSMPLPAKPPMTLGAKLL